MVEWVFEKLGFRRIAIFEEGQPTSKIGFTQTSSVLETSHGHVHNN